MEIKTGNGIKHIRFLKFSALDGWEIRERFASFANSHESNARREYVMRVLDYARVLIGNHEIPLSTGALIDNHLGTSDNIRLAFEGALEFNGIDCKSAALRSDYQTAIGNEIATSFVSSCMDGLIQFIAFVSKDRGNVG